MFAKKNLQIIGIDNWQHTDWDGYAAIRRADVEKGEHRTPLEQCRANLAAVGTLDFVRLIESDSIAAADLFANDSVDFIFIDDTHNAAHIDREISAWLPKLKKPGWIAGHDYPGNIAAGVLKHFPDAKQDGSSWVARI